MKQNKVQGRLLALSLAVAATLLGTPTLGRSDPGPDEVLDQARRAAGWDASSPGKQLSLSGRVTYLGVEETFVADLASDGRFRLAFEGELEREVRHDGQGVFLAEFAALWHELELFGREAELLRAWVHGSYWLDPGAPLSVRRSGERADPETEDGLIGFDLRIEGGRLEARVELDAEQHLVRALIIDAGNGPLRTEYANYATVDGRRIAREVHCQMGMGNEYTLTTEAVRFEELDESLFARGQDEPDFIFDVDFGPEIEVVRSRSKHLWVRPLVNGQDVGLFLFDTGAGFSGI
jgi:hypothetical protein